MVRQSHLLWSENLGAPRPGGTRKEKPFNAASYSADQPNQEKQDGCADRGGDDTRSYATSKAYARSG
jgi:hypothetical protein